MSLQGYRSRSNAVKKMGSASCKLPPNNAKNYTPSIKMVMWCLTQLEMLTFTFIWPYIFFYLFYLFYLTLKKIIWLLLYFYFIVFVF